MTRSVNRAARLQLKARLDLVGRAVELLRNKEEALRRERTRLEAHATRTEQQWRQRSREATTWLIRARALGASSEVTAIIGQNRMVPDTEDPGSAHATITIGWQSAMGVTYPGDVSCVPGLPRPSSSTAALGPTTTAYQLALAAGGEHAAADAALHRVEIELSTTRRRRRAIEQRLQPRLERELHKIDLDLDEHDRDAAVRSRLVTRRKAGRS